MTTIEYIKDNILLFDGAMGTYYADKSNSSLKSCELANLNDPETIFKIHREYIDAGAKAIKTNTFGANKTSLNCDSKLLKEIISEGFDIASKAAKKDAFVFADIGPIPSVSSEDPLEGYMEIADIFLEAGAENFLFETFPSTDYLKEISLYIKSKKPTAFILTEFAVTPEGYTRKGMSGKKIFYEVSEIDSIDALGFNCISGPRHLLEYIKGIDIYGKTVSIMPNAGYPTVINNRTFFDGRASYFASQMAEIAKQGVTILGGCCGTTPEFIKQTAKILENVKKQEPKKHPELHLEQSSSQSSFKLLDKINSGNKIIAVELDPPTDTDIDFFIESAKMLKSVGIDVITIADCPIARARVDSSLLACKIKRDLDIETMPHLTCRDRNINATKALLLGLNIEGIENVLVVTGDPIPSAQRDEIKAMFSFNSANLASYIASLNESILTRPFLISGALNVNARNFDAQLKHAENKIKSGVSMFLTQPVLTPEAFENLKRARNALDVKIIGGIMPIISYKNACFMNNEISGINVSDEIIKMYENVSKEEGRRLAVELSTKIAKEIFPYVDGYYIMTPFKRIEIVCSIISNIQALSFEQ
ncbi:MAG: bifunctional homocysteine S-methyltransferase/methylenetetrahydrofolate reductase [Lachnospiraceae bacterium]|jgi:homocysteine S-methyltransferase|nr:bifunctional homocysteine S-methyltransferase/methylenetetrahydrofolate reductase [Lachnospiraceae bacterium]